MGLREVTMARTKKIESTPKPFSEVGEITTAIADKESDAALLRDRMESDWDLLALVPYQWKKGYEAYTSSAPRNFYDKVLDGLNRAEISINIKLAEDAKAKLRKAAVKGEQFLIGALDYVDRKLTKKSQPPLRQGMGNFICSRGWVGLIVLVYTPEGKDETIIDIRSLDPIHMTWEEGSEGLIWAAYKRAASKAQILSEYGYAIEGKDAIVIDFWDEKRNAVIVGNTFVKEPTDHNIGHVPLYIGAVGSMPTMQRSAEWGGKSASESGTLSTMELRGDSVWTASRHLYAPRNKYASWVMDSAKRSVVGSLVHQSKDGLKSIKGDPFEGYMEIKTEEGEFITPLGLPPLPPEMGAVLGILDQDIQQSTLPFPLAYGGTKEALSGRALSLLGEGTKSVYSPRTSALAQAYKWLCDELLHQFKEKGVSTLTLSGHTLAETFFQVEVSPEDIQKDWYVSVSVEPRLPRDEEAEIMMALAATQKRGPDDIPLLSKLSARSKILQLKDPDSEEDRVLSEIGKAHPIILMSRIAAAMKKAGDIEGAELMLQWIAQQGGRSAPGAPGGSEAGGGQPAVAAAGDQGQPPSQGGVEGSDPLEQVIQVLVQAGRQDVAKALLQVFQELERGSAPPMPPIGAQNRGDI
jgi:hypothetical protein